VRISPVAARSPWSANEVIVLVVLEGAAAVMLGASWYVSSVTHDPVDQIPWLALGIAGTVVGAMAAMMFLLEGRRAVGARFWAAADRVEVAPLGPTAAAPSPASGASAHPDDALVAVPGTRRFHRADCILVAGKPASEATADRHRKDGREACPVCLPAPA
jgi:hypothetical protein